MLEFSRKGVLAIIEELRPRIIGRHVDGFTCNCGCVKADGGIASAIDPGGDTYPGQEFLWICWSVNITCPETNKIVHSRGLSHFVPAEELYALFEKHFGDLPTNHSLVSELTKQYDFPVSRSGMCEMNLPPMCKISDNKRRTSVRINWGSSQAAAKQVYEIGANNRNIVSGDAAYKKIVTILKGLNPQVIIGGPEPQLLEYESYWLSNWGDFLEKIGTEKYTGIGTYNLCITSSGGKSMYTSITVSFFKNK